MRSRGFELASSFDPPLRADLLVLRHPPSGPVITPAASVPMPVGGRVTLTMERVGPDRRSAERVAVGC